MPSDQALEIFELWQEPAAGLSFAAGDQPEVARWRLELGADSGAAGQRLTGLETQVRQAESQLEGVPGRLDAICSRAATGYGAVSFSAAAGSGADLVAAERDLLRWSRGDVSFSADATTELDTGRLNAEIAAATRRLVRLLTPVAWVETCASGRLLGQTVVGWTGKTRTIWDATSDRERVTLHQRNVGVALAARLGLLRTMVVVGQGAARVSMLLSATSGVGAVAALPMAWKFVQQVLAEVRAN